MTPPSARVIHSWQHGSFRTRKLAVKPKRLSSTPRNKLLAQAQPANASIVACEGVEM